MQSIPQPVSIAEGENFRSAGLQMDPARIADAGSRFQSTGDPPVPSDDLPDGTGRGIERKCTVFSHLAITTIPSGGSPGGAGKSPAPPWLN